jgi:TIR domain-containing protein
MEDVPRQYKIFFSHQHQDEPVTNDIISILRTHTDNLKCFISEDIEKGANWRKAITEHLTSSSFLVLVFTDPEENWGWCLYETGFFDALSQTPSELQARRIYCLHNPKTTPPSQIADLQSVPATVKDVSQWLEELFNITKTRKEFRERIPELSSQICQLFLAPRKSIYSPNSIDLILKGSSLKSPDDLPDDTIIQGDAGLLQELFGTGAGKIDWKSAKSRFTKFRNSIEANLSVMKEISRAAYCICSDNRVLPIQGTMFVGQGPKRYRPVISHAKEMSAGTIKCEILLIEDVGGPLQNVDKSLGALLTAIRMAVRIRWEIVRPFSSEVRFLSRDPVKLRLDLQTCLNNIFSEAEFRGTYSLLDLSMSFEDKGDKVAIQNIIDDSIPIFGKIWESIGFCNTSETFGEVSAERFTEESIALLEDGLAELKKINSEFLEMGVARVEALVRRELGKSNGAPRSRPDRKPHPSSARPRAHLSS